MVKKTAKLEQAEKALAEQQALVKKLREEDEERFRQFWLELEEYSRSLMKGYLDGTITIDGFDKVIIRRGKIHGNCDYSYEYFNAFCPWNDEGNYKNSDGGRTLLGKNEPRRELIESAIVGDGVLIDISKGLTYFDRNTPTLSAATILVFSYYYRQDQDASHAIQMTKTFFEEKVDERWYRDYGLDNKVAQYLYDLHQESNSTEEGAST